MLSEYRIFEQPKVVGAWQIGGAMGMRVAMYGSKPRWLTRVMCRWLLQWEWLSLNCCERHMTNPYRPCSPSGLRSGHEIAVAVAGLMNGGIGYSTAT
jgi:hypothetical protein